MYVGIFNNLIQKSLIECLELKYGDNYIKTKEYKRILFLVTSLRLLEIDSADIFQDIILFPNNYKVSLDCLLQVLNDCVTLDICDKTLRALIIFHNDLTNLVEESEKANYFAYSSLP